MPHTAAVAAAAVAVVAADVVIVAVAAAGFTVTVAAAVAATIVFVAAAVAACGIREKRFFPFCLGAEIPFSGVQTPRYLLLLRLLLLLPLQPHEQLPLQQRVL